jgi:hypothetical protein
LPHDHAGRNAARIHGSHASAEPEKRQDSDDDYDCADDVDDVIHEITFRLDQGIDSHVQGDPYPNSTVTFPARPIGAPAHVQSDMARGPHFKQGLRDPLPSANVDIAPTVARILGFSMPEAQGRVLEEALEGGPALTKYAVSDKTYRSSKQTGLRMRLPTDLDGRSVDPKLTTYWVEHSRCR